MADDRNDIEETAPPPGGRHERPAGASEASPADAAVDLRRMERALALAERGRATTSPNPMVGCVVVRDGEIVGEGWHERAGTPHAEVHALREAGDAAVGATAYVTLEPCDHHGRTPPCSLALVEAGVARVVVATLDPDPRVRGAGVRRLRDAGIEVTVGVAREAAERANEAFLVSQRAGRPFVLYKTAMTLDGKIATRTGHSRWITGAASRERVQRWRHELDAVAVGVTTVLTDDPRLTARVPGGLTPLKVVFDSVARTPPDAALFAPDARGVPARVLVVVGPQASASRRDALRAAGAEVIEVPPDERGRPALAVALAELQRREIRSVLLEGGGTLAWSFFAEGAVDRVAWFVAPKLIGGSGASPLAGLGVATMDDAVALDEVRTEPCGEDLLLTARVRPRPAPGTWLDGAAGAAATPDDDARSDAGTAYARERAGAPGGPAAPRLPGRGGER